MPQSLRHYGRADAQLVGDGSPRVSRHIRRNCLLHACQGSKDFQQTVVPAEHCLIAVECPPVALTHKKWEQPHALVVIISVDDFPDWFLYLHDDCLLGLFPCIYDMVVLDILNSATL